MMTLFVVFAAVALVVIVGEAVRGQCRRMLDRPVPLVSANGVAVDAQPTAAVAA
jgi:hypothetical protein